jgi:hypothetical protein
MNIFSFFIFSRFLVLYLIIYILNMIINHMLIEKITRNRKRPKKTFINFIIIKKIFDEQYRKKLEIFIFIDLYNHYINSVNIIN